MEKAVLGIMMIMIIAIAGCSWGGSKGINNTNATLPGSPDDTVPGDDGDDDAGPSAGDFCKAGTSIPTSNPEFTYVIKGLGEWKGKRYCVASAPAPNGVSEMYFASWSIKESVPDVDWIIWRDTSGKAVAEFNIKQGDANPYIE